MNWHNLRPWSGSQESAFEELVCQLAKYEPMPGKSVFIKKGAPDAGVECFWKFPDGKEYAWQAKFFTSSPSAQQWSQVDKSVSTALEKHPDMVKYIICLASDRSDARLINQDSFQKKWDTHVKKWTSWANKKNMKVCFDFWGSFEIAEKLSREVHRGRSFFWFNQEAFSADWFQKRLEESLSSIGPRYTRELNVKLEISTIFRGLVRSPDFVANLQKTYGTVGQTWSKCYFRDIKKLVEPEVKQLENEVEKIVTTGRNFAIPGVGSIAWNSFKTAITSGYDIISRIRQKIEKDKITKVAESEKKSSEPFRNNNNHEFYNHVAYYLRRLEDSFDNLNNFATSKEACLANTPYLLLLGDAGKGKTHLLADFADHHVKAGYGAVFLTGYDFVTTDDPWHQILRKLSLNCNKEEFLGALEAYAEATEQRAIIVIDALNEGEARGLWKRALPSLLVLLEKYKWIGLAISVRTTYEKSVIQESLINDKLVRVVHNGFEDCEFKAVMSFFEYYKIKLPSTPILNPEFHTPLFLSCFCKGLKNKSLIEIPKGLHGISSIFDFFLDSVNEKLASPDLLNFDEKRNIISEVISKLAEQMVKNNVRSVERQQAREVCQKIVPTPVFDNSLFKHLLSESILMETISYDDNDHPVDMIEFSYDRLADHIIAKQIIDNNLGKSKDLEWLHKTFRNQYDFWDKRGLLEAFSIQIPERYNLELFETFDEQQCHSFAEVFIDSLQWRTHNSMNFEKCKAYVNKFIVNDRNFYLRFLDILFVIAPEPNHPFNAEFIHRNLIRLTMAESDNCWSKWIYEMHKYFHSLDRLIDWACSSENLNHISSDSLLLTGKILSWLLTNSNRFIRDKATKALTRIFTHRLDCLCELLAAFHGCNDLYVLERLYAVAYGCSMRSSDASGKGKLARIVYQLVFSEGSPPCHILLRDYARGVIEVAYAQGLHTDGILEEKIRPPYKSKWPLKMPSTKEIDCLRPSKKIGEIERISTLSIFMSIIDSGDFARYVLGSDHGGMDWLQQKLSQRVPKTAKEMFEDFLNSLTLRQIESFEKYRLAKKELSNATWFNKLGITEPDGKNSQKDLKATLYQSEQDFLKTIRGKKADLFKSKIKPYLLSGKISKKEMHFPVCLAQRWILKRVFELGWSAKLFGKFERTVVNEDTSARDARKPERISKKYQWIAYHEFLAHLADNLVFKSDKYSDEKETYEGPWQIGVRDIDPSFVLPKTFADHWANNRIAWWTPWQFNSWQREKSTLAWLKETNFLTRLPISPIVCNPETKQKWLNLECYYSFQENLPPECDPHSGECRFLRIWLKSYLVRKKDLKNYQNWARTQNFYGSWMPSSHEQSKVFFGEFYWAKAFNCFNNPYNYRDSWTHGNDNQIPFEVLVTTDRYFSEKGAYDCSVNETINVFLPAKDITEKMALSWNGCEGKFFGKNNEMIAFDPSTDEEGPQSLLIDEKAFSDFLEKEDCALVWTLTGEKGVIGDKVLQSKFQGTMEISGFLTLQNGRISGKLTPYWVTMGPTKEKMKENLLEINKQLQCVAIELKKAKS